MLNTRCVQGLLMSTTFLLASCGTSGLSQTNPRNLAAGVRSLQTGSQAVIAGFDALPSRAALERIGQATKTRLLRTFPALSLAVFEPQNASPESARRSLAQQAGVKFVEFDRLPPREVEQVIRIESPQSAWAQDGDPYRRAQWYLGTMGLPRVWSSGKSFRTVKVAVVDTGIQERHQDLQGVLLPGYNAASPGAPTNDADGHGTMVGGLIAAVGGNGYGIHGAAPNAKLVPVKVGETVSSLVAGMLWAADNAEVVSMSMSVKPNMSEYPVAIESTKRAAAYVVGKGVPLVVSMGNSGDNSRNVPAAFAGYEVPDLIAVGATNKREEPAFFSTFGPWCSVSAPGDTVVTTGLNNTYVYARGTSFSTPLVAATVALMLGAGHSSNPAAVKRTLQITARDLLTPGPDEKTGAGRVAADRAVLDSNARR